MVIALCVHPVWAGSVTAFVDRNVVQEGESLQLTVKEQGMNIGTSPDLSTLQKDFEVLGTAQSTRTSIINGQTDIATEWVTTLIPKRVGRVTIPAIQVGDENTAPVTVTVRPAGQPGQAGNSPDVFLESHITPKNPYVQSQVLLTVKLFHAVSLQEARMDPPVIPNTQVEQMGEDKADEIIREGRRFRVIERTYRVFPQKSGVLRIPPIVVAGKVPDTRARRNPLRDRFGNRSGIFGSDPFGSLFQSSRPVRVRSQELKLTVRPIPPSMAGNVWLPAEGLVVQDQWTPEEDTQSTWKVGEPITRTIVVQAKGLTGVQLPEITVQDHEMLKVYPDQANVNTQLHEGSVIGTREQKLALVPSTPGRVTIPEIRIPWWNTKTDRQEVAVIPARTITILSATGVAPPSSTQSKVSLTPSPEVPTLSGEGSLSTSGLDSELSGPLPIGLWPGVAAVFLIGWVLTGIGWVVERKRKARHLATNQDGTSLETPTEKEARKAFQQACQANEPRQAGLTLLKWVSMQRWGGRVPTSVGELANRMRQEPVQAALRALDRTLYAPETTTWDGQQFLAVVEPVLRQASQSSAKPMEALPPLYLSPPKEKMVG